MYIPGKIKISNSLNLWLQETRFRISLKILYNCNIIKLSIHKDAECSIWVTVEVFFFFFQRLLSLLGKHVRLK